MSSGWPVSARYTPRTPSWAGGRRTPEAPGRVDRVLGLPGAPAVCALQLPSVVVGSLRMLRALARAGCRGVGGRVLAEQLGVEQTSRIASLREGGLIVAVGRGLSGSRLTRPAGDISLLDVVEAVGWALGDVTARPALLDHLLAYRLEGFRAELHRSDSPRRLLDNAESI